MNRTTQEALAVLSLLSILLSPGASAQEANASPFDHSPIRYRIDDSNLTWTTWWYKVRAQQAFDLWEEDLEGKLAFDARFEAVADPAEADIELWFRDARAVGETCGNATVALGCARFVPAARAGADESADSSSANFSAPGKVLIEVKMQREDGAYYSYRLMGDVLRHEIGHALGLPHSPDPRDVMFFALDTASYADAQPPRDLRGPLLGVGALVAVIVVSAVVIVRQMTKPDDEPEGPERP